jgi:F-type H+-transporting ATPase subunit gamma
MPSLKEIRNRVRSVKNTRKITRAMKLVAAAKLRRAQDAVVASRPYALKMKEVIASLVGDVDPDSHPLFATAEVPDTALIVPMTSDRGLAGAFNASLLRRTDAFLRDNSEGYASVKVSAVGRKGRSYYGRTPDVVGDLDTGDVMTAETAGERAAQLARALTEAFLTTEVDEVWLVFNEFKSALTQDVVLERILPLSPESFAGLSSEIVQGGENEARILVERIYEPSRAGLLDTLLPKYIESQILRALLESEASEQGARMTAMDNATTNASDLIDSLTLQMNRARQAIITTELMEITSGAESLKG